MLSMRQTTYWIKNIYKASWHHNCHLYWYSLPRPRMSKSPWKTIKNGKWKTKRYGKTKRKTSRSKTSTKKEQ